MGAAMGENDSEAIKLHERVSVLETKVDWWAGMVTTLFVVIATGLVGTISILAAAHIQTLLDHQSRVDVKSERNGNVMRSVP